MSHCESSWCIHDWKKIHSKYFVEKAIMTSFWKMTLMLPWQTVQAFIFSDSQTTVTKFWANSLWFLVIHKPLWKHFWGDSQWFTVIYKSFWNCFRVILSDSWWFVSHSENILGQFSWFLVILGDSQWISVIHESVWNCFWSDSQWLLVICKPLWKYFGASLGDSQQFSMILDDSWWFMNQSEIVLVWFPTILSDLWTTVIHEPFWKHFGVILCDSWISLKLFLGDSLWFENQSEMILQTIFKWCMNHQESYRILTNHTS